MIQSRIKSLLRIFGGPRMVVAHGRFTPAGTGAVAQDELQGVLSVVRAGVGVYTVTLPFTWKGNLTVIASANSGAVTFSRTAESASAKTVTITAHANGGTTATEQNGPACSFFIVARL